MGPETTLNPFYFQASLNSICGHQSQMAELVFDQLIAVLKELTKNNPYFEMLNFKNNGEAGFAEVNSYKDVVFDSGARASF